MVVKPYLKYKDSGIAWLGECQRTGNRRMKHLALVTPTNLSARSDIRRNGCVSTHVLWAPMENRCKDASSCFEVWNGFLFPQGDLVAKITPFRKREGAHDRLPTSIGFDSTEFVYLVLCSRSCLSFYTVRH